MMLGFGEENLKRRGGREEERRARSRETLADMLFSVATCRAHARNQVTPWKGVIGYQYNLPKISQKESSTEKHAQLEDAAC